MVLQRKYVGYKTTKLAYFQIYFKSHRVVFATFMRLEVL